LNVKLQGEKHITLDLITTARPYQKKFHIFKHVKQYANKLTKIKKQQKPPFINRNLKKTKRI